MTCDTGFSTGFGMRGGAGVARPTSHNSFGIAMVLWLLSSRLPHPDRLVDRWSESSDRDSLQRLNPHALAGGAAE